MLVLEELEGEIQTPPVRGMLLYDLKVRSLDVDRKEVTWRVSDFQEDVYDFDFQVLRSESPEGPFEEIGPTFTDRYIFVDGRVPKGNKYRVLWYKVRVTHRSSGEFEEYGPASQSAEASLDAQYIRRNEMTVFTHVIGRKCWLFKKRTFGPRCSSCWDSVTKKRTRSNCRQCFDTGFLRGYHDPIAVYVQIDPAGEAKQNQAQQISQISNTTARLSFYPDVSPGDVIVEAENRRWRVTKVSQSERLRAVIKQELLLHEIEDTDIEFRMPINLDRALEDIQPSPPRMFTNPTNLDATNLEQVPGAFDLFAPIGD